MLRFWWQEPGLAVTPEMEVSVVFVHRPACRNHASTYRRSTAWWYLRCVCQDVEPIIRAIVPGTKSVDFLFGRAINSVINNAPPFKYAVNRRQVRRAVSGPKNSPQH